MDTMAKRLQWALDQRGMTPAELAKASKKTGGAVSQWVTGSTKPENAKASTAIAFARALGVRVEWLVNNDGDHFPGGTSEPETASDALEAYSLMNSIKALQWINCALVGYLSSTLPSATGDLIQALEGIPPKFQETGPGGALLSQLDELRAAARSATVQPTQKLSKTAPSSQQSQP